MKPGHDIIPPRPVDGQVFVCSSCDFTATFVVLPDGLPGEWVTS